jgi:hypothetical protein
MSTLLWDWLSAAGEAIELASEDDRLWFENNPGQAVRCREAFVGELPPEAWPAALAACEATGGGRFMRMVEVRQIEPGVRVRRPFAALALGCTRR